MVSLLNGTSCLKKKKEFKHLVAYFTKTLLLSLSGLPFNGEKLVVHFVIIVNLTCAE